MENFMDTLTQQSLRLPSELNFSKQKENIQ